MGRNLLGLLFVTLTAPGKDVLPFDPAICSHGPGLRCDGTKGCRVYRHLAAAWNTRMGQNWSWLVEDLRREFGTVEYFKAVETHQRGVLHIHFVCSIPGVTTAVLKATLQRLAVKWQFGSQCDVQRISPGNHEAVRHLVQRQADEDDALLLEIARKAGYLAKYSTKGGKRGECITRDGEYSTDRGYRVWSASANFGPRMRELKARQRASWIERAGVDACVGAAVELLDLNSDIYAGEREEPWWEEEEGGWGVEDM